MKSGDSQDITMIQVVGFRYFSATIHYKDGNGNLCQSKGRVLAIFADADLTTVVKRALEHGYALLGIEYGEGFPEKKKIDLPAVIRGWMVEHGFWVPENEEENDDGILLEK